MGKCIYSQCYLSKFQNDFGEIISHTLCAYNNKYYTIYQIDNIFTLDIFIEIIKNTLKHTIEYNDKSPFIIANCFKFSYIIKSHSNYDFSNTPECNQIQIPFEVPNNNSPHILIEILQQLDKFKLYNNIYGLLFI